MRLTAALNVIGPIMIRGSCLCGKCGYEAAGELFDVLHCHCTNCRKLTGSAFSTYGAVSQTNFKWLSEKSSIKEFKSSKYVSRYICCTCGTLLISTDSRENNSIYLSVGLLDTDTDIKPEYHQFVASKAPWYEIDDGLQQFQLGR